MTQQARPTRRDAYAHLLHIATRWGDNDAYGHMNNVVYYALFDTAVNRHLIERGVLDVASSPVVGLVAETNCTFFSSVGFPDWVHVGMNVVHLGNSSVRYELAVFRNDEEVASALGSFVHVYVERHSGAVVPIPASVRAVLQDLQGDIAL